MKEDCSLMEVKAELMKVRAKCKRQEEKVPRNACLLYYPAGSLIRRVLDVLQISELLKSFFKRGRG